VSRRRSRDGERDHAGVGQARAGLAGLALDSCRPDLGARCAAADARDRWSGVERIWHLDSLLAVA
jgi:hypothetical protein